MLLPSKQTLIQSEGITREVVFRRFRHKPIVLRSPEQAESRLRSCLKNGCVGEISVVKAVGEPPFLDYENAQYALINMYECIQCDYTLTCFKKIEQPFYNDEYNHMVFVDKLAISKASARSEEFFLSLPNAYYLGYPVQVLLRGSGHDKIKHYNILEGVIEDIKKKFGVS